MYKSIETLIKNGLILHHSQYMQFEIICYFS